MLQKFENPAIVEALANGSKTLKKYLTIILSGKIEEKEITSMRSLMHKDKEAERIIINALSEAGELTLSEEQNKKGIAFLLNEWKTPSGQERKNNPFGYREQEILENFSHLVLSHVYNAGNAYHNFYLPLYICYDKDGNGFEYYYNGKVNIVG